MHFEAQRKPQSTEVVMKKLNCEALRVDSFATSAPPMELRGTVQAHLSGVPCDLTHNGCPTQYCATYPAGTCGGV
jgi:hypothetical protein